MKSLPTWLVYLAIIAVVVVICLAIIIGCVIIISQNVESYGDFHSLYIQLANTGFTLVWNLPPHGRLALLIYTLPPGQMFPQVTTCEISGCWPGGYETGAP